MAGRRYRHVVGAARDVDHHRSLGSGQLSIELVGAARALQFAELRVAQVQTQVRGASADLDRPGDLVRQDDAQIVALGAKQVERRKARAFADLQTAGLAVEADRGWILTARVIDVSLVERV